MIQYTARKFYNINKQKGKIMAKKTKMEKIYELQAHLRKHAKSNSVIRQGIQVSWVESGRLRAGDVRGEVHYKNAHMKLIEGKSYNDNQFVGQNMLGFEEIKLTHADTRVLEQLFFLGAACTPGEFKKMVEKEGTFDNTSSAFEMVLDFWYDMAIVAPQREYAAAQKKIEAMKIAKEKEAAKLAKQATAKKQNVK